MKRSALVVAFMGLVLPTATSASRHIVRQADSKGGDPIDDSKTKVCYPVVTSGTIPPCIEIATIESACQPNGTDAADYQAHAQCMCKGSFFADWKGCQNCLRVHGLRSERDNNYWNGVISVASNALCSGTPTAVFSDLFASAGSNTEAAPLATSGDTKSSDQFPGKTEVGLYYTATAPQGPGPITGAAATATEQATAMDTAAPESGSVVTSGASVTSSAGGNRTAFTQPGSSSTASAPLSAPTAAAPRDGLASGLAAAAAAAAVLMMAF
ncbi:hypothetical protein JDV02_006658 [Purpureocillium takamizusanense]|uniref:Collagen-like protein Mcl1 n=1 Tax=Purpureocillium takamizusanense TaxID=2060973 RepID=A0A9Q8VCY9_9HYPO|nr:uncharacterized protein JDV02_006658 [Purpureocillium takamizusanense]UNI20586.1 hypothetical protein JDV02_006658 [Purpureocillium takamizusanense]